MLERMQLNINIKPDLLKKLKMVALDNDKKLVELINEVLSNYIYKIKDNQTTTSGISDELDKIKNRISDLEILEK